MKKKTNNSRPMLESEKQITPMENEIDPKNYFAKINQAINKAEKRCKLDIQKTLNN
ncbi:hypothetical protein V2P20_05410 [Methylobacter sp. Wu1]|uniref:hypothetical protein n=1 Tax=Methylobacter sp. Wu1 TaxID=3119359 RepID=UPI002F957CC4